MMTRLYPRECIHCMEPTPGISSRTLDPPLYFLFPFIFVDAKGENSLQENQRSTLITRSRGPGVDPPLFNFQLKERGSKIYIIGAHGVGAYSKELTGIFTK